MTYEPLLILYQTIIVIHDVLDVVMMRMQQNDHTQAFFFHEILVTKITYNFIFFTNYSEVGYRRPVSST